jgi:cobalt-zinc-cadmium efflux system protein
VWQFGWLWADPAASLAIAGLVLVSAWQLIREAVDVLMEAAPRGVDVDGVRRDLGALAGVRSVHDLHVWTLGHGRVALSCISWSRASSGSEQLLTDAYTLLGNSTHRPRHDPGRAREPRATRRRARSARSAAIRGSRARPCDDAYGRRACRGS